MGVGPPPTPGHDSPRGGPATLPAYQAPSRASHLPENGPVGEIMSPMSTPGKTLVEAVSRELGPHMVWDQGELVTLDLIEQAEDRRALLQARFDAVAADPDVPPYRLTILSSECRLLETAIQKWARSLDPHNDRAVSLRHVHA